MQKPQDRCAAHVGLWHRAYHRGAWGVGSLPDGTHPGRSAFGRPGHAQVELSSTLGVISSRPVAFQTYN